MWIKTSCHLSIYSRHIFYYQIKTLKRDQVAFLLLPVHRVKVKLKTQFSGCVRLSVGDVEGAMFQRRRRHNVCVFCKGPHAARKHARTRRARRSHRRPRVSMQVIERDRRAPECHTWAPGGRRTTEVGRIQPFAGQPFTMERNQQPGLAGPCQDLPTRSLLCVQSADSAVWKLLLLSLSLSLCVSARLCMYIPKY